MSDKIDVRVRQGYIEVEKDDEIITVNNDQLWNLLQPNRRVSQGNLPELREALATQQARIHLGKEWEELTDEEQSLYLGDADEILVLLQPYLERVRREGEDTILSNLKEIKREDTDG
jgi:hypothetical protein